MQNILENLRKSENVDIETKLIYLAFDIKKEIYENSTEDLNTMRTLLLRNFREIVQTAKTTDELEKMCQSREPASCRFELPTQVCTLKNEKCVTNKQNLGIFTRLYLTLLCESPDENEDALEELLKFHSANMTSSRSPGEICEILKSEKVVPPRNSQGQLDPKDLRALIDIGLELLSSGSEAIVESKINEVSQVMQQNPDQPLTWTVKLGNLLEKIEKGYEHPMRPSVHTLVSMYLMYLMYQWVSVFVNVGLASTAGTLWNASSFLMGLLPSSLGLLFSDGIVGASAKLFFGVVLLFLTYYNVISIFTAPLTKTGGLLFAAGRYAFPSSKQRELQKFENYLETNIQTIVTNMPDDQRRQFQMMWKSQLLEDWKGAISQLKIIDQM